MPTKSKSAVTRTKGKRVETVEAGEAMLAAYYSKLPPLAPPDGGKEVPGGYKSEREFLFTYLVPYALNRLAAIDRWNGKQKKGGK